MSGKRILVIDDAHETRSLLVDNVLRMEGYDASSAADGYEALDIVHESTFDLIIADYLMPNMTGLEFLKTIRQNGILTPFILITAEGSEQLAVRALRLGVRDYLIKPFSISDFLDAIERILNEPTPIPSPSSLDVQLLDMIKHIKDPVIIVSHEQQILYVNDIAQKTFNINHNPHEAPTLKQAIQHRDLYAIFNDNNVPVGRYEIEINDQLIFNAHVSPIAGQGYVVTMQDISKLKELEKTRSEFVTAISHDLRSPLTTILGYVELLKRAGSLNEQQEKFTDNILLSVKSITALLTDLLELSKIEAGLDTTRDIVQMELIVRYAVETHKNDMDARQQELSIDLQPSLSPILGNPIRLKQMVSNLIQNAIKYTPVGGAIRLTLYEDDPFLILEVSDTGIGIPMKDQPYIWDKFFRSDETAERYPGTGLGLSIVKTIIEAHSGRIWLNSIPDEGTTFTVMLPTHKPDAT